VGLLIFTDQVELFIPPRKGRRHVLRLIRELLAFEPQSKGTDIKLALDTINQIVKNRSILFMISDFLEDPAHYRQALTMTNRRHDIIAVDLSDPMEHDIANVGLLTLEDAETGELTWVDTSDKKWQQAFHNRVNKLEEEKHQAFIRSSVDRINIGTDMDYINPLTGFFQQRAKRIRH
jgi:uncharacterized protein (DUF58 family)